MNIADNTHSTSAVALGRILSGYADGGRTLELLSHLRTAAHLRRCSATSLQVRLACLHYGYRREEAVEALPLAGYSMPDWESHFFLLLCDGS